MPPAETRAAPVVIEVVIADGLIRPTLPPAVSDTTPPTELMPSTRRFDVAPVAVSVIGLLAVDRKSLAVIVEAEETVMLLRAVTVCSFSGGTARVPSLDTLVIVICPNAAEAPMSEAVVSSLMLPVWASNCTVPATRSEAASAVSSTSSVAVRLIVPVPAMPVSMRPTESLEPTFIVTLPPVVERRGATSGRIVPFVSGVFCVMLMVPVELETLPVTLLVLVWSVAELVDVNTTSFVVNRPGVPVAVMPPCRAVSVIFWARGVRCNAPARSVPTGLSIVRSPADAVNSICLVRVELASPTTTSPVTLSEGAETVIEPSVVVAPCSSRAPLVDFRTRSPLPVRLTLSFLNCDVTASSGDSRAVQLKRLALI